MASFWGGGGTIMLSTYSIYTVNGLLTIHVLCTGLLSVCMYYSGCFCFQTEAIHPDCALIVQHIKAQEECNETIKQEENNHSTRTGLCILVNGLRKKIHLDKLDIGSNSPHVVYHHLQFQVPQSLLLYYNLLSVLPTSI